MDTHRPAPPPPPPPPPGAADAVPVAWWRRPVADLVDLGLVALAGVGVGAAAIAALTAGVEGWEALSAALLGLALGALTALVGWLGLVVLVARGRATPGERLTGVLDERPGGSRVFALLLRHVALVVIAWTAVATLAGLTEPAPAGPFGSAAAAAVGTAVALAVHGRGPWVRRASVVAVAAVAALAVAAVVPDRAPYAWELRADARALLVVELDDDIGARRVCAPVAPAGGQPQASHGTDPCSDPDRAWIVQAPPSIVAARLVSVLDTGLPDRVEVTSEAVGRGHEVAADGTVVVLVLPGDEGCTSRVVLDSHDSVTAETAPAPDCP